MPAGIPPVVKPVPHNDEAFARAVEDAIAMIRGMDVIGTALEAALRTAYPAIQVKPQNPLASVTGGAIPVWYAFRDGDSPEG